MGKVYDALQRAEGERARRLSGTRPEPESGATVDAPTARASQLSLEPKAPARRVSQPFWRRIFGATESTQEESAGELNKRRIALLQPESHAAECFRGLRGRIDAIALQRPIRSIAVTSALPAEGKTLSALNFALVSSMAVDRSVLLIDCDLRRPRVHQALGLRTECGLAEVLEGRAELNDAIVRAEGSQLDVLPVHGLPSNPSELLSAPRMKALVEEAISRYDSVILDVPPVLGLPEAKTVSELCDGIVFIVRADRTSQDEVESALDVVDRARLLGVVFNGSREAPLGYRYDD